MQNNIIPILIQVNKPKINFLKFKSNFHIVELTNNYLIRLKENSMILHSHQVLVDMIISILKDIKIINLSMIILMNSTKPIGNSEI